MGLFYNSSADGEAAPEATGGKRDTASRIGIATSVTSGELTSGAAKNDRTIKKFDKSGSILKSSFVLKTKRQSDPERLLHVEDTKSSSSSPDAQGQKKMLTRKKLTSAAAITGAGFMMLALHSCGQKPAPAEETAAAKPAEAGATQAMRVSRVEMRDLADEFVASGRLVVREEAAVGSELPGYRVAAVYVDEGDWVKQGQAMAKLDDALLQAQIAQAEATLATQKASLDFKKSQLARAEIARTGRRLLEGAS